MIVNALVEGDLDDVVARRVVASTGHEFGVCYGKRGIDYIQRKLAGFNNAARSVPLIAMLDHMDTRLSCPPEVAAQWLPNPQPMMLFCVIVRELESWLLADGAGLAAFPHVRPGLIPDDPEGVPDPKRTLVNIARSSRTKRMRDAIVPREDSTSSVGILYTAELSGFVRSDWDLDAARSQSESLDRCLRKLERIPPQSKSLRSRR